MKLLKTEMLILRTCDDNGKSYGGFQWPKKGAVVAPDWRDDFKCGGGLHGLPWGVGSADLLNLDSKCWIVFKALAKDVRQGKKDMVNKCKVQRGVVVYCGAKDGALAIIHKHAPKGSVCIFGVSTAGDSGTATAGGSGTATAGDRGTATAGYSGTATAGDSGTATAGYRGTATAGAHGVAASFYNGLKAKCQKFGCIILGYWDGSRYRQVIGYEGENGIKADVWYTLDADHKFTEYK